MFEGVVGASRVCPLFFSFSGSLVDTSNVRRCVKLATHRGYDSVVTLLNTLLSVLVLSI